MSVEQQVDALAISVENLKSAVVSKKATLDASVVDAQSATAQAKAAKSNALSARDQAGAFKDAAYTAAQSAASAVAYQDLSAVALSKAITAVDVFIYDTSKDSDGGAWRHRCSGTSWYREPLNTATRGARRDFPAVAIILVEGGVVRIYDADDPAMPMWIVFQGGYNNIVALGSGYFFTSACAKNGVLVVGHADGARAGLDVVNFITDAGKHFGTTEHPLNAAHGSSAYKGNVAQRNAALGNVYVGNIGLIANNTVNDVAMTVLPDAPIDPATRLPVPTIAVATAGGVSVIKDDETVVSRTLGFPVVGQVSFSADHYLFFNSGVFADAGGMFRAFVGDRPSILIEISLGATAGYGGTGINLGGNTGRLVGGVHSRNGVFVFKDGGTSATNPNWDGPNLTLLNDDRSNKNRSMIAAVRSNFSTGWLPGDIKGAFLADTEDADLVGAVAFRDGFSNYADDAALQAAWMRRSTADTGLTMLSGGLRLENLTAAAEWASRTFPTIVGATYRVRARRVDAGAGVSPRVLIGPGNFNGGLLTLQFQVNGEIEGYFRATGSSTFLGVTTNSGALGAFAVFDDIEVVLADADRSVNNRGLLVNGTITRAPVAMGAELVGYAGGGANYLSRDFAGAYTGHSSFSLIGWYFGGTAGFWDWHETVGGGTSAAFLDTYMDTTTKNFRLVWQGRSSIILSEDGSSIEGHRICRSRGGRGTMTSKLLSKRSAVPGKVPTTVQIDLGELAMNTRDGKLYLKRDNGNGTFTIVELGTVRSVAGKTGEVILTATDVGLGQVNNTPDRDKPVSTSMQTALEAMVSGSRRVETGIGLTGGGDLAANRTIAADVANLAEARAGAAVEKLMSAVPAASP